jgi:FkbM family methyltransferase
MNLIKRVIQKSATKITSVLYKTKGGRFFMQYMVEEIMHQQTRVIHKSIEMLFCTPNWLNNYRAETFSTKEPETLEWIESIPNDSVLWDIGANVGLYSIYAAKAKNCRVFSFEPSVFNLELLARNIFLNKLQHLITIVPVALSSQLSENLFRMSTTQWGGALSTFGENIDQDGNEFREVFEYKTVGLTMEQAAGLLKIPLPKYIKMDVDGIEHFILQGGGEILKQADGVLIEINDEFVQQSEISEKLLKDAGLSLYKKCYDGMPLGSKQFNQWWKKGN